MWMVRLWARSLHSNIMIRFFVQKKIFFRGTFHSVKILEMHSIYFYTILNDRENKKDIETMFEF